MDEGTVSHMLRIYFVQTYKRYMATGIAKMHMSKWLNKFMKKWLEHSINLYYEGTHIHAVGEKRTKSQHAVSCVMSIFLLKV